MSIIRCIFHCCASPCRALVVVCSAPRVSVGLLGGALCGGGTSESVRVAAGNGCRGGRSGACFWLLYLGVLVVVVGTEVPYNVLLECVCVSVCVRIG